MAFSYLRKEIKKGRQSFIQAAQQARQVNSFVSNPITFCWRVIRQGFNNWLNASDPPEKKASEERHSSQPLNDETKPSTHTGRDEVNEGKRLEQTTLEGLNFIYIVATENLAEDLSRTQVEKQYIYGGYKQARDSQQEQTTSTPILIKKVRRDRYEESDRQFQSLNKKIQDLDREYDEALKFRILLPREFIYHSETPHFIYIIYDLEATHISNTNLKTLENHEKMSPIQIDGMLKDIWQSLEHLHNRLQYPENLSIAHGNISSQSFLISQDEKVYIWQLGLWHKPIALPHHDRRQVTSKISITRNQQKLRKSGDLEKRKDIRDVGQTIKSLILDEYKFQNSIFYDYISRVASGYYTSCKEAHKELRNLKIPQQEFQEPDSFSELLPASFTPPQVKSRFQSKRFKLVVLLIVLFFSGLGIVLSLRDVSLSEITVRTPSLHEFSQQCSLDRNSEASYKCQIKEVYASITSSVNILYSESVNHIVPLLQQEIEARQGQNLPPKLNWLEREIDRSLEGENIVLEASLLPEIKNEDRVVAYDGLAIFVSHELSIQNNFGEISFESLQDLYEQRTIEVTQEDGGKLQISLRLPPNPEFNMLLESLLSGTRLDETSLELADNRASDLNNYIGEIVNSQELLIGVAPISAIFGQCQIYPLAIVKDSASVQPLIDTYNRAITPETELCDDKGGYWANFEALAAPTSTAKSYPLSYAVVVSSTDTSDNSPSMIADLFRTNEAQSLFRSFGLVPCRFPDGEDRCQLSRS
ncbi:hypothetical protein [Baaleninema simplex]|uniref:hypothetical protein n=1 Tax=Baaleninema simplex TaxID=2862350 RepID=UPI0003454C5D|nr:hypothetical protein [Baaleninema simplex]